MRAAMLAAVLVLAVSTAWGSLQLTARWSQHDRVRAGAERRASVAVRAAETNAGLAGLRAAAVQGAAALTAAPTSPMDAAEIATATATGPDGAGGTAGVVRRGELAAVSAGGSGPALLASASAAASSRAPLWSGGAPGGLAGAARSADAWVVVLRAIAPSRDGVRVFDRAGRSLDGGTDLRAAFRLDPVRAWADAARDARGGAMVLSRSGEVLAAAPALDEGPTLPSQILDVLALLAPLAAGGALTLLTLRRMELAERDRRETRQSERRFRLAVEAARAGIWEWDLVEDRVFLSEVTGAMLGWGGAGVAAGAEVVARIAPEHRGRVRQAVTAAGAFGAFDVSFATPGSGGARTWIDMRGQAAERGESGYRSLIGVAVDVTAERAAQTRAQAAEGRLQDAIESVSRSLRAVGPARAAGALQRRLPGLLQPGGAAAETRRPSRDGGAHRRPRLQGRATPGGVSAAPCLDASTSWRTGAGCRSTSGRPRTAASS